MAEFVPTKSQKAAIDARGSAVLVSAGAGSGKTRVLTERLMAYLTGAEPVDIDRFLVITFTRAAAGELRGRIAQAVAEALAADPSNRRLRRQSALLRRAERAAEKKPSPLNAGKLTAAIDGEEILLTPTEFQLLSVLVKNAGIIAQIAPAATAEMNITGMRTAFGSVLPR